MKTHILSILSVIASVLASASSCVYPFEAELEGDSGTFVIEGDIIIGNVMPVSLSYTASVSTPKAVEYPENASVWVEDDRGGRYDGRFVSKGLYSVDMTEADPGLNYRLMVTNGDTGLEYASAWEKVCKAPQIDSLSYIVNEGKDRLDIALSMHSEGESYFRWKYREDWEFHTIYRAYVKYIPPSGYGSITNPGTVEDFVYPENNYYCWKHEDSKEIMTFSTESQTEDRFVDLAFHSIPRTDRRISMLYHIEVELEPVSKDAYLYWENMKRNSEYNGNLFSPNPSEMLGNIRCLNDTTDVVFGYINVAQVDTESLFFNNSELMFYKNKDNSQDEPLELSGSREWFSMYKSGLLPYDYKSVSDRNTTLWAPASQVDCTCMGGTKQKPSYWPNDHQ